MCATRGCDGEGGHVLVSPHDELDDQGSSGARPEDGPAARRRPGWRAFAAIPASGPRDVARVGRDVEALLDELESRVDAAAWPRVEPLVRALVTLYGGAMDRLLAHARAAAATREGFDVLLAEDELLSSLLLIHRLHPIGLEQRIELALRRLRAQLPTFARLEIVDIDVGIVRLRPADDDEARPPPTRVVARAIEREAPEITGVRIDGRYRAYGDLEEVDPL